MNDSTRDLLVRGVAAAKAKDYAEARYYLEWLLRIDPPMEHRSEALYWLAEVTQNPVEKRERIEEVLAYNPSDMRARRALAILTGQLKTEDLVDPDKIVHPIEAAEPDVAGVKRFICPQCGGRMTYTADGSSLTCEYCEARQGIARTGKSGDQPESAAAQNFLVAMATRKGHLHPVNRRTFICQGCGIDFILPPEQLSLTCPYCGSAYVVDHTDDRELMDPHLIFPFKVSENQARQVLKAWFVQQGFQPDLRLQVGRGVGVYLPVWSFEMAGQVPWSCLVEKSRNRWEKESNIEIVYHYSVLVPATTRLKQECIAELKSFDLKQAVTFDERYLADWPAETYQTTVGDASLEARRWTYEFEKKSVRSHLMGAVRDLTFSSLGIAIESFKLVLVPLWITHYHLDQDSYQVVINGQTGAVRGQHPLNWLEKLFK
jgi:predicted RNA-binding Zn-ribbon protein involved in translation (DUF1610 family)